MSINSLTKIKLPGQVQREVAAREKERRKRLGLTQAQLANRSGVSLGSLRRFEQEGQISFESLVSLSFALGCAEELGHLFSKPAYRSIDEVLDEARKRR